MTPAHEEVRAACSFFEIPQLYAAFLHLMVAERDLVGTDTTSKGSYAPTLFTVPDTSFQELAPSPTLGGEYFRCELVALNAQVVEMTTLVLAHIESLAPGVN